MTMIEIEGITKSFGATEALRGVTLSIAAGEIFACLGPNGSGKTTLIRILTGLCCPGAGRALVAGCDVSSRSYRARMACGLVSQGVNLDLDLSVAENLEIHGKLFGIPARERPERIRAQVASLGLEDKARALVRTLSGGQQRRVMIARALLHQPKVLFLDEPTVGLDPAIRRRMWALIKGIQAQGTTVFLTTHYIEEAEHLADRVAFLDAGALVRTDAPQRLVAELGDWVVDHLDTEEPSQRFFPSREAAQAVLATDPRSFALRRVCLEDAYLALTGKRITPRAS